MDNTIVLKTCEIFCCRLFSVLSLLLVAAAVGLFIAVVIKKRRRETLLKFCAFLAFFAGIWCIRYAVGYYSNIVDEFKGETVLNAFEEIFNSVAHSLQTFSMDEDYTDYILNGKDMMLAIFSSVNIAAVYGIYAALLNMVAPIAGGAIILEVLVGIFPQIKLWGTVTFLRREKLYFSKLNDRSLALAKSLYAGATGFFKPIIVFTDVHNEENGISDLVSESKLIGAICISDDLAHALKPKKYKRSYFLIDEVETPGAHAEISNLHTLVDLSTKENCDSIRNANIYLFSQEDIYTQVERRFIRRLRDEHGFAEKDLPVLTPVKSMRNLAVNLFKDVPLYEPIVCSRDGENRSLTVTVMGSGGIGTEMILAAYWMGQMLDVTLNINVVSKEKEADFRKRINYINPEILATANADDSILIHSGDSKNPVYCNLSYTEADIESGIFWDSQQSGCFADTDYFVIALGSDGTNLETAEKLRRYIGECHVNKNCTKNTVIAYAIYDSDMCEVLNTKKLFTSFDSANPDIYMHAFGSLREEYSYENLFMPKNALMAKVVGDKYDKTRLREEAENESKKRANVKKDIDWDLVYEDNEYKYWANHARTMHVKYKVFSLGWITTSVFDTDEKVHNENVTKACATYRLVGSTVHPKDVLYSGKAAELWAKANDLAWLEHRRWNAFTRVMGFKYSEHYKKYMGFTGSYKHMSIRLHPCLVESDRYGTYYTFVWEDGKVREERHFVNGRFDRLDELDAALGEDFKKWDYPYYEFDGYKPEETNQ